MPILAMPFWEGAGNKVYDYSGNKNSGSITGAEWKKSSLYFVNTDSDEITLPSINIGNKWSIAIRFYETTSDAWGGLVAESNGYGFYYKQNLDRLTYYDGGDNQSSVITVNCWHDAVVTLNDTAGKFYIDGTYDSSFNTTTHDLLLKYIGSNNTNEEFGGYISYVYAYKSIILTPSQIQALHNNPYGMFEPRRRPPIWSIPSGGAINFSGTSGIQTSTKGAALAVTRPLSGTSALATTTASAILAILRVLSGTSAAQSSTTTAALALIRALDGISGGTTQTSSPILNILRALSGTSTPQSATSDAILAIARALAGQADLQTLTSDAQMTLEGLITFLGTAAGATQTKDAILAIARDLSGTSAGQPTVADAALAILRSLAGTSAAQTETTDAALEVLRSLSGTAAGQSATTDAAMALLRSLVGTAAADSATSEAVLAILRELEGSADMASATSDAIMALAALGVLVDTILESLTPVRTVESLTPVRTVESI